jgi:primosomal protein N' (replication factor Y)
MLSPLFADNSTESYRFADVILPLNLPQTLTYGIPHEMQGVLRPGMRVEVSLGRNKQYSAIVERLHNEQPEAYQIKPLKSILDNEPVVNNVQLQFWRWIAHYYLAAPGEVMQAALPAHMKLMGETRLEWIGEPDVYYEWSNETAIAADALQSRKEITLSELRSIIGLRHFTIVINELIEKEVVSINDTLESSYKPRKEKIVTLAPEYHEEKELSKLFDQLHKAPKQLELIMAYVELNVRNGFVKQADLLDRSGASGTQVKMMVDKGIFIVEEQNVDRLAYTSKTQPKDLVFTEAQQVAYNELEKGLLDKEVALLHGVTGSGKTLLYIHKIKQCLAKGKQAIFLLPEIGLTTHLVSRLYAYFGEEMGVYHSRFTNNERVEIWEKVRKEQYKLVVGARSALWLPYKNVGLIICDEEHDASYKQKDPAPRFHARDAAIYLASLFEAKVILGSATPSVESLYNVQQKKYAYASLKERYLGINMPTIEIVNAKSLEKVRQLGYKLLTPELQQAMIEALQHRKQVILFQNRRGYAPFQLCMTCGYVPQCKNCAVSLTYHKSTDKLHCHYCGLKSPVIHHCPSCGGTSLQSKSFGTEKIEEEVQQLFPEARVARMDVDSMRNKQSMPQLLEKIEKQKIDILVGTQMVVKGLDFEHVSLVGVLSADSLLSYPDFRVNERAFQLMEQVSGRAGRTDGAGKVLIQAYNMGHPVLKWVQEHDMRACYDHEIKSREYFGYPPFSRLIKITFKHRDEVKAIQPASEFVKVMQQIDGIVVQGPVPAVISRVRNQYVQEVWIKCPRDLKLIEATKEAVKHAKQNIVGQRGNSSLQVLMDVDPV